MAIDKAQFKKLEQGIIKKVYPDIQPIHKVRVDELHPADDTLTLAFIQGDASEVKMRITKFIANKLNIGDAQVEDEFVIIDPEE